MKGMKKTFGASFIAFLALAGTALAVTVILTIYVNAAITVPARIVFPPSFINEEQSKILFIINSTVTDVINITSYCTHPDMFSAIVTTPTGSTQSQFTFINNGTTFIQPNLTVGNVMLKKRSLAQGIGNCTLDIGVSPSTNITIVGELN